nr:hypothetical protein [Acidimicrobiia bacterium]
MIGQDEWRSALAALAGGRGDPALRHRAAVELAGRMVAMAGDDEGESLGFLLRPDPKLRATCWRVRQFRLGDIAPTSVTDHTDAALAVIRLARPDRDALVAGELLAVAADGSAWVALTRNESEVVVQAPAPDTLLGPGGRSDGYGPLLGRWRAALDLAPLG